MAGAALLLGYVLQTTGLQYTSSATSAFITYLLVVFVPVLGFVLLGRRPHPVTLAGIAVAVVGLVLLTDPGGGGRPAGFGKGELLTLGCAIAFAAHVVILGETAHRHDPIRLAAVQVTVVGAGVRAPGVLAGRLRLPGPGPRRGRRHRARGHRAGLRPAGDGQRTVPPARAAVLLLVEPVFAALLAAVTGDPLARRPARRAPASSSSPSSSREVAPELA